MATAGRDRALGAATVAVGMLGLQAVALLVTLPELVRGMASNADLASPLVMGHEAASYPRSELVTGNYAWWNGLWATQGLSRLPGYDVLAAVLPLAATLAATGVLAWVAARLWRPRAGLIVALVVLATGPQALMTFTAWSSRAPTWWAMAAVAAVVTLAASGRTGRWWWVATVLAVLWAAAALAGDKLAWLVVIVPLLASAASAAGARAWRVAGSAAGMAAAIAVLAPVIAALARAAHYRFAPAPLPLVEPIAVYSGLLNAVDGLGEIWQGPGGGTVAHALGVAGAVLALTALVAGVIMLAVRRRSPAPGEDPGLETARRVWVAFFVAVLATSIAGFAATEASGPLGAPVVRYLYAAPFAVGALLAALSGAPVPAARLTLPIATGLGAVAALALLLGSIPERPALHRPAVAAIERAIDRYDLDVGYASYWTAAPLARALGYRHDIQPVGMCATAGGEPPRVCPAQLHYVRKALEPRRGARSFLLVDARSFARDGYAPSWLTRLPAGARPERTVDVGDGLRMAIFATDVAAAFGPFNPYVR